MICLLNNIVIYLMDLLTIHTIHIYHFIYIYFVQLDCVSMGKVRELCDQNWKQYARAWSFDGNFIVFGEKCASGKCSILEPRQKSPSAFIYGCRKPLVCFKRELRHSILSPLFSAMWVRRVLGLLRRGLVCETGFFRVLTEFVLEYESKFCVKLAYMHVSHHIYSHFRLMQYPGFYCVFSSQNYYESAITNKIADQRFNCSQFGPANYSYIHYILPLFHTAYNFLSTSIKIYMHCPFYQAFIFHVGLNMSFIYNIHLRHDD